MDTQTVRTKEWLAAYRACKREYPESVFGLDAKRMAEKAADAIIYPKETKEKDNERSN